MKQKITINGTTIKSPSNVEIGSYNLTKSGRVASGKMTMELIAKKTKLNITYEIISGLEMNVILAMIDSKAMFFNVSYVDTNVVKTKKMYVGEINKTQFRTDGGWYWKNVTFNFIEQ